MGRGIFIVVLVIIGILLVGGVLGFLFFKQTAEKQYIEKPDVSGNIENIIIQNDYISYILNELGAYQLRSSPLTGEKPVIKTVADEKIFTSEIDNGKIITKEEDTEKEDLIFITTKKIVIDTISSDDMGEYFKNTIVSGETTFEIKASKTVLFSKGYLNLYKELTGEDISITGQIIKIFNRA